MHSETKLILCVMTTFELNAEIYRAMAEIADDETLMTKVLKYVKSLLPAKKETSETGWADRFAGSWKEMDDQMLDAALAEFSGDFGGNADSSDIARELRQGAEMVRDIKTW